MNIPHSTFAFIFHFVRRQWLKFSVLIVTAIGWAVNDAFFPYFLKRIINTLHHYEGIRTEIYVALKEVLILLAAFWLISELLTRVQGIVQIYTFPIFRAQIRSSVFNYTELHSQEYFSSNFAGSLAKKITDLPRSCQIVMENICTQFVTALTGILVVLIMMWQTKALFAYILLIWLCLHLSLTVLMIKRSNHLWERHADAVSVLSGKIVDIFANILNVRLFAHEQYELNYLRRFQREEISKAKHAMWAGEVFRIGLGLSGLFLIFSMVFVLLQGWIHGWVTLGDFTQVSMQAFWLLGWVWYTSFQLRQFTRELGSISNALRLIQKGHGITDIPNARPILISQGKIQFDKITFGYHKRNPLFKNFSVSVSAGEKVGLVGFSGSGKTTFANLILRFYDLPSGKILIDQQDIAKVTQDSLRAQIGMIPQDALLFHRTLMENIRYGRLAATDQEVIQAAKLAHCHEFIEKLDLGYQSLVGERGIKLSGGQRQRIAIARAILKNAPILILDEATSSLDSVTEKLIHESLQYLMQHKTTIVIAHRLSTLSDMDTIFVFHHGKIVESGSIESLLAAKGHFAKLWEMQNDGFLPD